MSLSGTQYFKMKNDLHLCVLKYIKSYNLEKNFTNLITRVSFAFRYSISSASVFDFNNLKYSSNLLLYGWFIWPDVVYWPTLSYTFARFRSFFSFSSIDFAMSSSCNFLLFCAFFFFGKDCKYQVHMAYCKFFRHVKTCNDIVTVSWLI